MSFFEWLKKILKRIRNYPDVKMNLDYASQRMKDLERANDELLAKIDSLREKLDASQATIDSMQAVYEQRLHQQANEVRSLKNKAQKPKRNRLSHKEKAELYKKQLAGNKRHMEEKQEWKAKEFNFKEKIRKLSDELVNRDIVAAKACAERDTLKLEFEKVRSMLEQNQAEKENLEKIITDMTEGHNDKA